MSLESPSLQVTYSSNSGFGGGGTDGKKPPDWNPHVLNKKEEETIPEPEKVELMRMPGEEKAIWIEGTTSKGMTYWYTIPGVLAEKAPSFHNMLKDIINTGVTHLVLGGFRFQLGKDKVIRGKYEQKKQGGQSSPPAKPAYAPRPLAGVMIGEYSEINDFVNQDENKGKWNLFGDWKFDPKTGEAKVGIIKNTSGGDNK